MTSNLPENDEKDFQQSKKPTLQEVIHDLTSREDDRIPTSAYYGLSNLSDEDISTFKPHWNKLDSDFKVKMLTEFAEASEINFEFDYQSIGYLAIDDSDSAVRAKSIAALWIDESTGFLSRLIELAETDESTEVRAIAASEIGRFILIGEYKEIPESEASLAQDVVINLLNDSSEDLEVRRRSLEAISNSSLDFVPEAIREAYESDERLMKVSAIFAMGRSYDEQWTDIIMREIHSDDPEIRYEAARSAGELEIEEAVNLLGQIAVVDEREIREVAIWSLGEIGGSQALRLLTALGEDAREANDEDLLEAIEDAIGFASMSGSDMDFDFEDDEN